jgi:hypothetical protein
MGFDGGLPFNFFSEFERGGRGRLFAQGLCRPLPSFDLLCHPLPSFDLSHSILHEKLNGP